MSLRKARNLDITSSAVAEKLILLVNKKLLVYICAPKSSAELPLPCPDWPYLPSLDFYGLCKSMDIIFLIDFIISHTSKHP